MINRIELESIMSAAGMPEAGRQLVRDIFEGEPVRKVKAGMNNVRTMFFSKKMEREIIAESRTVELAEFRLLECSLTVLLYFPQAITLSLNNIGTQKGVTRITYTPDAFVIERAGNGWTFVFLECRDEQRLCKLEKDYPHRFHKDEQGQWHDLAMEHYCAGLGFVSRVISSADIPQVFYQNSVFLADYLLETCQPAEEAVRAKLSTLLAEHGCVSHTDLIHEHGICADDLFKLLCAGTGYVDLDETLLSETKSLVWYRDKLTEQAHKQLLQDRHRPLHTCELEIAIGSKFTYDGKVYEVALPGTEKIWVKDSTGHAVELDRSLVQQIFQSGASDAQPGQFTEAEYGLNTSLGSESRMQRGMALLASLDDPNDHLITDRHKRRLKKLLDNLPRTEQLRLLMEARGGNESNRFPERSYELFNQARIFHNSAVNRPVSDTFAHYETLCGIEKVPAIGRSRFYELIKLGVDITARMGKRWAYQLAPLPFHFNYGEPVHGVMPHQVVYFDHTVLGLETEGVNLPGLGRPVLSLAFDGSCSRARALILMYRPPSVATVLMLLRDYVRRWGCLPRVLVLDNAKEFHSKALNDFCKLFGIEIRWRRAAKPRDSTLVERAIGVGEQELINTMEGNTQLTKDPRLMTKAVNPKNFSVWTLTAAYFSLEHFFFEVQPNRLHSRLGVTPVQHERRLYLEMGRRAHRVVRLDRTFMLLTAAHPDRKPFRDACPRRGVYVEGQWYWHDKLATLMGKDKKVEVRCELFHASVNYACVGDEWVVVRARDGRHLEGRYLRELEIATRVDACRLPNAAAQDRGRPENNAARELLRDPTAWDTRIRAQSMEEYYLYSKLGVGVVMPEAAPPHADLLQLPVAANTELATVLADEAHAIDTAEAKRDRARGKAAPQLKAGTADPVEADGLAPADTPDVEAGPEEDADDGYF